MPIQKKVIQTEDGEFKSVNGMKEDDTEPFKVCEFEAVIEPPARVDLRKYCSAIEDQSQSNSCCANAVVGAYEYLCLRESALNGAEDNFKDISRLFVYYVGRLRDKQLWNEATPIADEGMTLGGAIDALSMKGACTQTLWPFDLSVINQKPDDTSYTEAMNFKISECCFIPVDEYSMKSCLAEGYPIIFGLKLTKRFFNPGPQGIIKTPDPADPQSAEHGMHAMLIVGYSDATRMFIVRNSWGEAWGDKGYCYVPYDYICNSDFNFLGQYAIYGLTDFDFTPDEEEDSTDFGSGEIVVTEEKDDFDDPPVVEVVIEVEEEGEAPDLEELEKLFDPLEEARRVFGTFDVDGNDQLTGSEVGKALRMNGTYIKGRKLRKLVAKIDEDGSGSISFEEFCRIPGVLPADLVPGGAETVIEIPSDGEEKEASVRRFQGRRGYRGGGRSDAGTGRRRREGGDALKRRGQGHRGRRGREGHGGRGGGGGHCGRGDDDDPPLSARDDDDISTDGSESEESENGGRRRVQHRVKRKINRQKQMMRKGRGGGGGRGH